MIEMVINPKPKDLGDNFFVRRSLPNAQKRLVGPYIFWDHMGPVELNKDREMLVRSHPHIGLATITYLFSGSILHRDSLNNEQYIKPGEVNWMTAGSGITHSERAKSDEPLMLEGIQLWVALPKEHEEIEASFYHGNEADLPMIEKDGHSMRLIAGEFLGEKSPVPVYSSLFYLNGNSQADSSFEFDLNEKQEAALYVINGELEIDGNIYKRYDLIVFKQGSELNFKAKTQCEYMIFGGDIFEEGRHIWWNFVSSSKERIEQAKEDWKNGKFKPTINETDLIPLPEN